MPSYRPDTMRSMLVIAAGSPQKMTLHPTSFAVLATDYRLRSKWHSILSDRNDLALTETCAEKIAGLVK